MLFKRDELKLLWPFYLYYLIYGLSIMIMPFFIIYFRELGFSFFQLSLIFSSVGISIFLFEIPTGAFADGFSRKGSVILGFLITGFSVIMIPFLKDFYPLFLLWFMGGIGMTFISGAEESWVISNLNKYKRKDLHHEFFVKSISLASIGAVIAPLVGSLIVKFHSISILWFIFGGGFILNAFLLTLFAKEHYKPKKEHILKIIKNTFKNSFKAIKFTFSHKTLLFIFLGSVFSSLMFATDTGWQPFLVELSMPEHYLGIVFSIAAFFMIIFTFLSKCFLKFKIKKVISTIIFLRMAFLLSIFFVDSSLLFYVVIGYIFAESVSALKSPLMQTYLHKFLPEKMRATLLSVNNMKNVVVIPFSLIAGSLMDIFGMQKIIAFFGFFGIFAIISYLKLK